MAGRPLLPLDGPRAGVWALRAAWVLVPLLAGPAVEAALDERSAPVRAATATLAWGAWALVLVALLVPRASSLTVARTGVPAGLVLAAWAAGPGAPDGDAFRGGLAISVTAVAVILVLAPATVDAFVNGSAYGTERRFALRTPPLLALLGVAAWAVAVAGATAGPLLLAARQWAFGVAALVVGLPLAVLAARSLHGLARRWLVLVPSGVVVHDPVARPDSVMAPRPFVERLAPAARGSDALDLSLGASGLALELESREPLPVSVRRGRRDIGTEMATRVLVTPARPATVLAAAAEHRLPVG